VADLGLGDTIRRVVNPANKKVAANRDSPVLGTGHEKRPTAEQQVALDRKYLNVPGTARVSASSRGASYSKLGVSSGAIGPNRDKRKRIRRGKARPYSRRLAPRITAW